jgi:hypothetical protein
MHDVVVRTTIDIPDDLHRQALAIARDTARTLGETIAILMRRGLDHGGGSGAVGLSRSDRTGLPVLRLGTTITTEDVRALEDDQ